MRQKILDAAPEKRIFLSIISEYDLKRSLCELIDNAIDLWTKRQREPLVISIVLDEMQQSITIEDNSGGIEEASLDQIVSPGKTSNDIHDNVIGYFGVGSKRGVIALAQNVAIHSRFEDKKAFTVKFDDHWIFHDPDWHLPYFESTIEIRPYSTLIELNKLRTHITDSEIVEIGTQFSEIYSKFIDMGVTVLINGSKLKPISFENQWSYPPGSSPRNFKTEIVMEGRKVNIEIITGLLDHPGDPDNSYGVFMYCNNRLISRGLIDSSIGFVKGLIGNPHYNKSLVRTIVKINGQSRDMPWDSSKSGIDFKHPVFQGIRQSIIDATKVYAQISTSLQGKWETDIFPFQNGNILEENLVTIASIPKRYLPAVAASRKKWPDKVIDKNSSALIRKPWARGLLDSIIGADMIFKSSLVQKNRICLIILDSTVEIGFKEYLVNEKGIGIAKFKEIAENRAMVQDKVLEYITFDKKQMNYYYILRCDLIHHKATANITDEQIEEYRELVEKLLADMFGLDCS